MSAKSSTNRTRNYATVVYPDSAPENWESILASHFVQAFISPLHENDINPTGEPKKPHYHVIIMFDSTKTMEQAREVFSTINGVGCEVVKSIRGYARYLCHLDNPEKAQYDPSQVRNLCGADYVSVIGLAVDKYIAISEMEEFCEKYNVISFFALSKYARRCRPDWHRVLCDSATVYMREYLHSKQWSEENQHGDIIDPETGEVL